MRPKYEVADVFRKHWTEVERHPHINKYQLKILGALKRCRTAELGGHIDACTDCGETRNSYNSCRNRHCPKCQGKNREEWIQKREEELLPVPYFHVVFTLPDLLNPLTLYQPKHVYNSLFEAAWLTIKKFGADYKHLGGETGMICILHTWGQQLTLHPHLHCIVPGGGLTPNPSPKKERGERRWLTAKSEGKYLFPVKAMSKVFRAIFIEKLKEKTPLDKQFINNLFKKEWVVFAKRPFGSPQSILEYIGRYTHKIAISNNRITDIGEKTVSFSYKDYRNGGKKKIVELEAMEFIRRFSMHILPSGFVRIRHYGFLSSTSKKKTIPLIKEQLSEIVCQYKSKRVVKEYNPRLCPHCQTETMKTIEIITKRGPPELSRINWANYRNSPARAGLTTNQCAN